MNKTMVNPGSRQCIGNVQTSFGDYAWWFERFRNAPFPFAELPSALNDYVDLHSDRFAISRDIVAVTSLTQLVGTLARNISVRSFSGSPVHLPFSMIVGTSPAPGCATALRESYRALADLQAERLETAARLDRGEIEKLKSMPQIFLPDYAKVDEEWAPGKTIDARLYALDTIQHPVFFLESPGYRELRNGFAASYDRTLFAAISDGFLERLTSAKLKREEIKGIELLARLTQGGQIDLPGRKATSPARVIQPHFGMLGITMPIVLQRIITHDLPEVQTMLRHCIFLNLANSKPSQSRSLSYDELVSAGTYWKETLRILLEARRSRSAVYTLHPSFYEPLIDWSQRQQAIAAATPEPLRIYLPTFSDLPVKLGSLFLTLQHYGGLRDRTAAEAAVRTTEWLMAHTLLAASDAWRSSQHEIIEDAKDVMFAKIRELQPIDFWRLRRRFNKQDKALHQPTLEALIEERRVKVNEEGKLVAA